MRSVTGNALVAFDLHGPCRMTDQSGVDHVSGRRHKVSRAMAAQYCRRAIRAFLRRCRKFRLSAQRPVAFGHTHHAMMFAIPPAARRQVRLTPRREREK